MKKTIYSISVAILIVLGVTKSSLTSAQGNGNSEFVDRAVPMITTENYYYSQLTDRTIPVMCDGIESRSSQRNTRCLLQNVWAL